MAAVFVAQATNTDMTLTQQLTLLAVLLLTSKGAAGVTGSGFIVLASTLGAMRVVPSRSWIWSRCCAATGSSPRTARI